MWITNAILIFKLNSESHFVLINLQNKNDYWLKTKMLKLNINTEQYFVMHSYFWATECIHKIVHLCIHNIRVVPNQEYFCITVTNNLYAFNRFD